MKGPSDSQANRQRNALRILIIGGTGFIGSHHVHVAQERGHIVTVLGSSENEASQSCSPSAQVPIRDLYRQTRAAKKKQRTFPEGVKFVTGDLYGDLSALEQQSWDAVIDCAQFAPQGVRNVARLLRNQVDHYTLISTISVYPPRAGDLTEDSPTLEYQHSIDPYALQFPERDHEYGSLKVLCEREAAAQFPGKSLIIRPGVMVGPGATADFLAFWFSTMEAGREIAVPGDPQARVQLLDARDLAEWVIRMVENSETGTYNATGPAAPLTNCELLGAIRSQFSSAVRFTWLPSQWLIDSKIDVHPAPLFWTKDAECTRPNEHWVSNDVSSSKAYAKGLTCRPLAATLVDSIAWFKSLPREQQVPSWNGWKAEVEQHALALWHSTLRRRKG
jgi:2'-hydroxyisoflavone reductase